MVNDRVCEKDNKYMEGLKVVCVHVRERNTALVSERVCEKNTK